jgi:CHAT domain-containing protein
MRRLWIAVALCVAANTACNGQTASFVAPPRTIADITAILDQQKPDPARIAKLQAEAEAAPPQQADDGQFAQFYYQRAQARSDLGRIHDAVADVELAIEHGRKQSTDVFRMQQFLLAEFNVGGLGDLKRAQQLLIDLALEYDRDGTRYYLFSIYRHTVNALIAMGDLSRAKEFVDKNIALLEEAPAWPQFQQRGSAFTADVELSKGVYFYRRGQYREAELALTKSETLRRVAQEKSANRENVPARSNTQLVIDNTVADEGLVKARQQRLAEAEADMRRSLLSRLHFVGKYHATTARTVGRLAYIIKQQGRYAEAEKLARTAIDIYRTLEFPQDGQAYVIALEQLASVLPPQRRWRDAAEVYGMLDAATIGWTQPRRDSLLLTPARIVTLYEVGNLAVGIESAKALVKRETARVGEQDIDTAIARGILAVGLARTSRNDEALAQFQMAVPLLTFASDQGGDDDSSSADARDQQTREIVESYIALQARLSSSADNAAIAVETFGLADAIRGRVVQNALAASTARMIVRDPALAELARREQDLQKQIAAQLGLLNNVLASPPTERGENAATDLREQINQRRAEHKALRQQLGQQFPTYVDLIDPKPPSVESIKAALRPDEVFLSFYFGNQTSFVWALPANGPISFAAIPVSAADMEKKIRKLREALEPQATTVSDIPPFNLPLAYEIYSLLLKPVERSWKGARNLIMATNGALGTLPLGLLPTAPSEIKPDGPLFLGYRNVPWLARTHAVTLVPSAAALRTLRQLPQGSATRDPFIGFGDPYFSVEQAKEAEAEQQTRAVVVASADGVSTATRGLPLARRSTPKTEGVSSAELGQLPRLPDTADELIAIAKALGLDPDKVLHLGKAANELAVATADLSHYRIIDFATHGLVPGDLNGLTQPALALTSPAVAGVSGDGLLTMEEILALKLDADWVVLSACNTGAGAGAGAEAASGLGQAFFYAGTRAILVTNWSVHSQSARELVTDLFRRQAADARLSRGEALRQAMMALLDGKGFTDNNGKTVFTYGHPLFWAPYTIIGDGG